MKTVLKFIFIALVLVPLGFFFCCTYLSPLHATDILLADFLYNPDNASTEGWKAFGISVAIWIAFVLLYYVVTAKILKQDVKSDRYYLQSTIIYLVLYFSSTAFVIYYIVKFRK